MTNQDFKGAEQVARGMRQGDATAVRQVRARVSRALSHRRLRISSGEREDLEQEIMMEVWQAVNRRDFDPSLGFWGFIEVVTFRRCVDWLRSKRDSPPEESISKHSARGPLTTLLVKERYQVAKETLAALGSDCRELISLHFAGRKSYRELSKLLGKSEGALRVQMHRCVRKAREIYAASQDHRSETERGHDHGA